MRYRYIGPNKPLLRAVVPLADGSRRTIVPDDAGEFDVPDDWRALTALDGATDMRTGAPLYARMGMATPPAAPVDGRQFTYVGPALSAPFVLLRLRHEDGSRHEYRVTPNQSFAVEDAAAVRALLGDAKYREVAR